MKNIITKKLLKEMRKHKTASKLEAMRNLAVIMNPANKIRWNVFK